MVLHALVGGLHVFGAPLSIACEMRTDRYCPNVSSVSASGRYRFESTHPNNSLPKPLPFVCTGFTIKLTDTSTGAVNWEREQGADETAAGQAWVTDSGRVVIDSGTYHLLDANGEITYTWTHETKLDEADQKFIEKTRTTAGVRTNQYHLSRQTVLEHAGRLYFVTRYFWGKRIFVDLDTREAVDAPSEALLKAADDADRAFVVRMLDRAVQELTGVEEWDQAACTSKYPTAYWAEVAVFLAGQLKITEVVPHLRKLEECGYFSASGGIGIGRRWENRPWTKVHAVRRAAHTALRRMGEDAGSQACYTLTSKGESWTAPQMDQEMVRARLASWVKVGMDAEDLFEGAGPPEWAHECYDQPDNGGFIVLWEYDIDGAEPSTLQVFISTKGAVTKVQSAVPPTWRGGFRRDVGDWR